MAKPKQTKPKTTGTRQKAAASRKKVAAPNGEAVSPKAARPAPPPVPPPFPVVGIGASAGGLEALELFFTHMPPDSGMAFVVVQHLDPSHKSILDDLVKRYTRMRVDQVSDGMAVEPNRVYVIPPNRDLTLMGGTLQLLEPATPRGLRMPIDMFLRSLAADRGDRAVCIVLSGTGTEGTLGLKAVKGEGGLVMVQDPGSAKYDGMPRSAAATGLADFVLPPERMPEQLLQYLRRRRAGAEARDPGPPVTDTAMQLQKVFVLLRAHTGHDFSLYKQNTILRRIDRRMAVNQIEDMAGYVRFLRETPQEIDTLFKEVLIEVTSFFRDPEAFEALGTKVLPGLLDDRPPDVPLRVWVPGCSTGEEAYSIAILLLELMEERKAEYRVQIFATDLNAGSIETARKGLYPSGIAADVNPERLRRYFAKEQNSYRVKKEVRDLLVFSEQSITKDPPFSRIDLVSCRNLLIYLGPEIQKRLIPLFHYALNAGGTLFLGSSETIGTFSALFRTVDRKWKLFRREGRGAAHGPGLYVPPLRPRIGLPVAAEEGELVAPAKPGFKELTEQLLLEEFAPAAVVINERCEIHYVHGRTGKYLEPAAGTATMNLLAMAREGLQLELTAAVRKARAEDCVVRKEGLRVRTNGQHQIINLSVQPVTEPPSMQGLLLVVFENVESQEDVPAGQGAKKPSRKNKRVQELEQELAATKEYLQTTIEELETSNEEMKSTNEELQSSNEELQSTNEELETSKEELQSVNEELTTVNTELENKIEELSRANDDLNNLLVGTDIATVFLDTELRVKRFTPTAANVVHLIQTDIDRPLGHVATKLEAADLVSDAREVLRTLAVHQSLARASDDCWYSVKMLPYRTTRNVIEGVVITFVDVTESKRQEVLLEEAQAAAEKGRDLAEAIIRTIREPLLVLDDQLKVVQASEAFYRLFQVKPEETLGSFIYRLGDQQWDIPGLRKLLEEILPESKSLADFEVEHEFPHIGKRRILLNASRLEQESGESAMILLAVEDVTSAAE